MTAEDPDFHRRDLNRGHRQRERPRMAPRDAGHALRRSGRLPVQPLRPDQGLATLGLPARSGRAAWSSTATPRTFFAEVEQAAFSPANLVPGTGLSPDRMLMGGSSRTTTPTCTGSARTTNSSRSTRPGSRSTLTTRTHHDLSPRRIPAGLRPELLWRAEADPERAGAVAWSVESGELGRYAYAKHAEDDDFGQAGDSVRQVMDDDRP